MLYNHIQLIQTLRQSYLCIYINTKQFTKGPKYHHHLTHVPHCPPLDLHMLHI